MRHHKVEKRVQVFARRVELGGTTLIVSRGLGVVGLPLRIGAPPELVVIRLTAGEADGR